MDDMEAKLGAILGNPEMMQQIMTMAQSLGQTQASSPAAEPAAQQQPPEQAKSSDASPFGGLDLSMIQKISGLASQTAVDQDQRFLLKALGPYLSQYRIQKLEKAMRAAKLAQFASTALNQSNFFKTPGR